MMKTFFAFKLITRSANRRDPILSPKLSEIGEMLVIKRTLALERSNEALSSMVSLESRYPTKLLPSNNALTTLPRADKEALMACVSFKVSPSACDFFRRSLPAKSTKQSRDLRIGNFSSADAGSFTNSAAYNAIGSGGSGFSAVFSCCKMSIMKTACDRDDTSFMAVCATERLAFPIWKTSKQSCNVQTSVIAMLGTASSPNLFRCRSTILLLFSRSFKFSRWISKMAIVTITCELLEFALLYLIKSSRTRMNRPVLDPIEIFPSTASTLPRTVCVLPEPV
mmetsp:Transcript_59005/g.105237  ORF Transcript_59005/g.105237 Transcript_59005/m.105237 type:complete len:281 (+) Transcript_59005:1265-2107(+)